jgi:hypothetical protein
MRGSSRRTRLVAAAIGLVASLTIPQAARAEWDPQPLGGVVTSQHYQCGTDDRPEGEIQGDVPKADQDSGRAQQGYNCGLALVGHTTLDLDGRPNANANMAWAGRCAYIAGSGGAPVVPQSPPTPPAGAGVAVVQVSKAGVPTHVANLRTPGSLTVAETINAVTTPQGRSILVVGQYGNDVVPGPKPMDVYDVSNPDCTRSKFLGTYYWPENIHNLTISGNGRYVFATEPLQAMDISPLWDTNPLTGPTYLGNLDDVMPGPPVALGPLADLDDALPAPVRELTHPLNTSHEAWPSADGTTVYVGGVTAEFELFTILDLSSWLRRDALNRPAGPPRVISQRSGRGHSVRTATIDGVPYVLHSEEAVFGTAFGCIPETANPFAGPAQPWLTSLADPTAPELESQFGLEINNPENCLEQMESGANQSVHYHDVDDPKDTTFVMASMWNAGIRVFDVRDPANPTEVAYFNPGDVDPSANTTLDHAWGHVRYVPESGQIWFATADGGFWVVRIEGQVRSHLDLDARNRERGLPALHVPVTDPGRPGTVGVTLPPLSSLRLDLAPAYCTLGSLAATLP